MAPSMATVQDLLDRDRRDPDALERQHRLVPVAAIGRVLQRQRLYPLHRLRRGRLRVRPVDRRQVLQTLEALRLKPPLPFIEAGPVKPALPTRLGDIAELPGQFQHAQPALRQLRIGVTPPRLSHCR
jgi:hypothetical protein